MIRLVGCLVLGVVLGALGQGRQGETVLPRALEELGGVQAGLARPGELGRAWAERERGKSGLRAGKLGELTWDEGRFEEQPLEVAVRLPKGYGEEPQAWPLVLCLPEAGEDPAAHLRQRWSHRGLQQGAILAAVAMPKDEQALDRVALSGRPGGLTHALTALRLLEQRLTLDPDRVLVAGTGDAVRAAMALADHAPQAFAGVACLSGEPRPVAELDPFNLAGVPVLFASGGALAGEFVEAVEAQGHGQAERLPGADLDQVWAWLQERRRDPLPSQVQLRVGKPFPTRAHWLRLAPIDPAARAVARLDRETNGITVEASGVSFVTLYLSDAHLDLDRPITVRVGGVEHRVQARRDLDLTLDLLADGTSDGGVLYTAQISVDARPGATPLALWDEDGADAEYMARLSAAQGPEDLLALSAWCRESGRASLAAAPLERLLRTQPDHEQARQLLGHVPHPHGWFPSEAARARYAATQEPEAAQARGWVQHKGRWLHPEDRRRLTRGWLQDPGTGWWLTKDEQKLQAKGWTRHHGAWVPPEAAAGLDQGWFYAGGRWLPESQANRVHARLGQPWELRSPEARVLSHADRATAQAALAAVADVPAQLERLFGLRPALPLTILLARDEEQYDRLAFGAPDGSRRGTHAGRLHTIHHAFFAESRYRRVGRDTTNESCGVALWDAYVPYGDRYGFHAARLALGLAWLDAIDPSPKAERRALKVLPEPRHFADFEAEKQLPPWLRWGAAVYVERYYKDPAVDLAASPDADPWWPRTWSLQNLEAKGGLRPLPEVLAADLDPDDREGSQRRLLEWGLLVAFLLDGQDEAVQAAHQDLRRNLLAGRAHPSHLHTLEEALQAAAADLAAFPGS